MGVNVKVTDKGGNRVTATIKNLSQAITFGVRDDAGVYPSGVSVATVASAHEFGDPAAEPPLPQRSWLRGWVASGGQSVLAKVSGEQLGAVVDGAGVDTLGEAMGVAAVKGITARIEQGVALQALAPATKANPKRDSRHIPLQDTGLLVDSISWGPV